MDLPLFIHVAERTRVVLDKESVVFVRFIETVWETVRRVRSLYVVFAEVVGKFVDVREEGRTRRVGEREESNWRGEERSKERERTLVGVMG